MKYIALVNECINDFHFCLIYILEYGVLSKNENI